MKISVIIPTRNREKILKHCIGKLLIQTHLPDEIIVVDDASTDRTEELISKIRHQKSNIKYIRFEDRRGHWYARNTAIKKATGELIIFVDSDVLVDKKFVQDHLKLHQRNKKIVVQGLVRHILRVENFGRMTIRIDGICFNGLVIQNCSAKKEHLLEAGLFDEFPLMGYMDVELGMRLAKLGVKKLYASRRCIAYHVDGEPTIERIQNLFMKFRERGKTSIHFISKTRGKSTEALSNFKVIFLSNALQTTGWAEKEWTNRFLLTWVDSPFFFVFPILKEIIKYHYRATGIREAKGEKQGSQSH